jgi:transglutaminase-like putative cysteine protease
VPPVHIACFLAFAEFKYELWAMHNFKLFPALLLLFFGVALLAQQVESQPADSAAFRDEAFVFEQLRTVIRFENDGRERREQTARVRVQSDAGVQRMGQLVFGYSSANEQMEMAYVRVRRPDGTVIAASAADVQDLPSPVAREAPVYSDFREKHITVPGLQPGQELEYSIVVRTEKPLIPDQFWTEYSFEKQVIVLDEELEINLPRQRAIKLKTQAGFEPKTSEEGDRRIYRWTSSNRKRESDNDKKKKPKRPKPELPDIELSTLSGWDEVGRWYWELQKDRIVPTAAVRAKAEELIRSKTTDLEKVEALYDFVATNFHYVSLSFGMGRYQPHPAGDILSNRYGDCKDKHTLLASLLEAVGLHAYPALINSSREIDPEVPSPSQFDHVITVVPLQEQYVWMDTTTEVAPFRLLALPLRNKQALVIPGERPAVPQPPSGGNRGQDQRPRQAGSERPTDGARRQRTGPARGFSPRFFQPVEEPGPDPGRLLRPARRGERGPGRRSGRYRYALPLPVPRDPTQLPGLVRAQDAARLVPANAGAAGGRYRSGRRE